VRSICFLGLDNYPLLNADYAAGYIGGESVQQTLLARAFVAAGYDVSMIVKDCGQSDEEVIDGIRVLKAFRPGHGIRGLRYVHPRTTQSLRALWKANADVYYQSCAGMLTGLTAAFCRLAGKRFVFRVASDADCIPGQHLVDTWYDRKIYEFGLRNNSLVAAQTDKQRNLLIKHYGIVANVINMVVEPPAERPPLTKDIDVLWVNNFRPLKRPELVAKLAIALPTARLAVIGGPCPGAERYYDQVADTLRSLPNVDVCGAVPYREVNNYFSRAKLFINTSEVEGFPNSFLQAWIRGLPVVSFFDPDSLIERENLGTVPETVDEMARTIKDLLGFPERLASKAACARAYAEQHFTPDAAVHRYIEAVQAGAHRSRT